MASVIKEDIKLQLDNLYVGLNCGLKIALPSIDKNATSVSISINDDVRGETIKWDCTIETIAEDVSAWVATVKASQFYRLGKMKYYVHYAIDGDSYFAGSGWVTIIASDTESPAVRSVFSVNGISADTDGNVAITANDISISDADNTTVTKAISTINDSITTVKDSIRNNADEIETLQDDIVQIYLDQTKQDTAIAGKQDKLTFDTTPTSGSDNPVTSSGIATALANLKVLNGEEYTEPETLGDVVAIMKSAIETLGGSFIKPKVAKRVEYLYSPSDNNAYLKLNAFSLHGASTVSMTYKYFAHSDFDNTFGALILFSIGDSAAVALMARGSRIYRFGSTNAPLTDAQVSEQMKAKVEYSDEFAISPLSASSSCFMPVSGFAGAIQVMHISITDGRTGLMHNFYPYMDGDGNGYWHDEVTGEDYYASESETSGVHFLCGPEVE